MNPLIIVVYFGLISSIVAEVLLIWLMKSMASKVIMGGLVFKTSMDMAALPFVVDASHVSSFLVVIGAGVLVKTAVLYYVLVKRIGDMAIHYKENSDARNSKQDNHQ